MQRLVTAIAWAEEEDRMVKLVSWRLSILACVLAATAGSATAQTVDCDQFLPTGNYAAVNVSDSKSCSVYGPVTVSGNVTVGNAGAALIVAAGTVTVSGNVTVGTDASLAINPPARFTVHGSLFAVGARSISIIKAHIHGSVFVTGTTVMTRLDNVFIGGNLSIVNSAAAQLNANTVAGNVLFRNNKTADASNRFTANTIVGSLVCTGNTHSPTDDRKTGVRNKVGRHYQDQCSGL
jgi:hypothetical protein